MASFKPVRERRELVARYVLSTTETSRPHRSTVWLDLRSRALVAIHGQRRGLIDLSEPPAQIEDELLPPLPS